MAFSDLYDFDEVSVGLAGWNAILQTNMEKVETWMFTIENGVLGENVSQYQAVKLTSTTYYKAQANVLGVPNPAVGLAYETGTTGNTIRIQMKGAITNSGWAWTPGQRVYLSTSSAGALTQSEPAAGYRQVVGIAISATKLWLGICFSEDEDFATSVTYENLDANGDVGTGAAQVSQGTHNHSGVYSEPGHGHTESDITDFGDYLSTAGGTVSGTINMLDNEFTNVSTATFGDPTVSGTYRITTSGTDLVKQQYDGSNWGNKSW